MKRIGLALVLFLLAGCSAGGADTESAETVSSRETASSSQIESDQTAFSSEEGVALAADESVDTDAITLYIPTALRQDEASPLYEDVISIAEQFTAEAETLSNADHFTLVYTGYYIENNDGTIQGYFMGFNQTGMPLRDLEFTLDFIVGETPVWENTRFTLYADEFGEQPDRTAMPIFLDVPPGKEELLINAEAEETFVEITDLQ